ncbi:NUDIX domain-containing protein [Dysgonomonas sp. 216]|uniref:NUDIX hydrolase n=1 Tax=Dysgonomonas sp. 216 TaxID=2302934 RepID=UPI0013D26DDF|nr:NUDIX domain-containing protein [Dysgonomonas sp. 216]NDW17360.1 NUDIX domain-containing protein [Dysgonomonas sp. 216]
MHPLSQFKYCPKCGSVRFIENNFKSKKCEDCKFVYYFNSCGATVALIVNDNNELLVATRAHEPAKGTLDMPGGFVDMDETAEQAVIREVKEETGLDITNPKYLFSLPNIYVYSGFEVHTIDMFFVCLLSGAYSLKADDDVAKLEFMKLSEIKPELFGLKSVKLGIEKILSSDILNKKLSILRNK